MQDRPTAQELLQAVEEFLARDVRPKLDPLSAFHTRVAENVLAILRRELEQGAEADARERASLAALLGADGELAMLNRQLAGAIRAGLFDRRRADLSRHLRQTVRDKLKIDNPRYFESSDE